MEVFSKLVIGKYAELLDFYADVEERLTYEEYERIAKSLLWYVHDVQAKTKCKP